MDQYEVGEWIGGGSFGAVHKITRKSDNQPLVWKAVEYGQMDEAQKKMIVSEVNILRELRSPFIVRYYDRIVDRQTTTIYIVTEHCSEGDLSQLLLKTRREGCFLDESFIWQIAVQLILGLHTCHHHIGSNGKRERVLHRDLKPANVFLDAELNAKLGDFGMSKQLKGGEVQSSTLAIGTPVYMSPEVVNGESYDERSDIWALGCVLYEAAALKPPFTAPNQMALAVKIDEGKYEPLPDHFTKSFKEFVDSMLTSNRSRRPYSAELLNFQHQEFQSLVTTNQLKAQKVKYGAVRGKTRAKTKEISIEMREKEITRKEESFKKKEAELVQREAAVEAREIAVSLREHKVLFPEQERYVSDESLDNKVSKNMTKYENENTTVDHQNAQCSQGCDDLKEQVREDEVQAYQATCTDNQMSDNFLATLRSPGKVICASWLRTDSTHIPSNEKMFSDENTTTAQMNTDGHIVAKYNHTVDENSTTAQMNTDGHIVAKYNHTVDENSTTAQMNTDGHIVAKYNHTDVDVVNQTNNANGSVSLMSKLIGKEDFQTMMTYDLKTIQNSNDVQLSIGSENDHRNQENEHLFPELGTAKKLESDRIQNDKKSCSSSDTTSDDDGNKRGGSSVISNYNKSKRSVKRVHQWSEPLNNKRETPSSSSSSNGYLGNIPIPPTNPPPSSFSNNKLNNQRDTSPRIRPHRQLVAARKPSDSRTSNEEISSSPRMVKRSKVTNDSSHKLLNAYNIPTSTSTSIKHEKAKDDLHVSGHQFNGMSKVDVIENTNKENNITIDSSNSMTRD